MPAGVIIEQRGSTLILRDAHDQVHNVTEDNAFRVLMSIVNDSTLPPMETATPDRLTLEDAARAAAEKLIPEPFRPFAALGLQKANGHFKARSRRRPTTCRR